MAYQNQQPQELPLVIVEGSGPTLLGRNWLEHFRLDWNAIKSVQDSQQDSCSSLLQEFQDVFTDELGTIKPFKAKLSVDPNAAPRFHRPRSVPYAMKGKVEAELDRLKKV